MEVLSFVTNDQLLDTEICVEEIKNAFKILKLGESGLDSLSPEHIVYGWEVPRIWLKKIFNRIIALEEVSVHMKEGLLVLVYKRQGKDLLLFSSYLVVVTAWLSTLIFKHSLFLFKRSRLFFLNTQSLSWIDNYWSLTLAKATNWPTCRLVLFFFSTSGQCKRISNCIIPFSRQFCWL